MKSYLLVVLINVTIVDTNYHYIECDMTKVLHESLMAKCYMNINNKMSCIHTSV